MVNVPNEGGYMKFTEAQRNVELLRFAPKGLDALRLIAFIVSDSNLQRTNREIDVREIRKLCDASLVGTEEIHGE